MSAKRMSALRSMDKAAWGVHVSFPCPEMIEFCGCLGFEWLLLDAQHMPLSHETCRQLVRAADVANLPCVVRVPKIEASVIEGYLDVGVIGILAPNVASVADARALVAAVKFSPEGNRGAAARSRAANYGLTRSPAHYARHSNETTVTAALIETQQGIDNLDAIMTVPGLDYVAIGPNDLGFSLGIRAGMHDARVRELVESAQERIQAQRKPQLTVVSDSHQGRKAAAAGAKLIAVSDAALLASAGSSFLNYARDESSASRSS